MKNFVLPLLLLFIAPQMLFSQSREQSNELRNNAKEVRMQEHVGTPSYMSFNADYSLTHEQAIEYSKGFCTNSSFTLKNQQTSKDGKTLYRYTQTIAGYPVEFSAWHIHERDGRVTAINGDIVDIEDFDAVFSISEEAALQIALKHIGAEVYMWMDEGEEQNLKMMLDDETATYYPTGDKVITPVQPDIRKNKLTTAYKFKIYSLVPFDGKMVYVDAQTGEILFDLPLILNYDAVGTAHTQYSGVRDINTFHNGTNFILHDKTRGQGIRTRNCQKSENVYSAVEFTSANNIWNNVNPQLDQYATDAHWAVMKFWDYLDDIHGRNSLNGNGFELRTYVHYGNNYVNAGWFWDGYAIFGDGSGSITPLVTIDIVGHELGHGLVQHTSNFTYSGEQGGLHEGFADIWGKSVEFYAVPEYANWVIGEKCNFPIRNLQNPKALNGPSTYQGQNWNSGSTHSMGGPIGHWFYLLSEGGSGVNDKGNAYQVAKIGMEKAEQVAFKTLSEYLTASSGYADAYTYGIAAAVELFGGCTPEVQAVGDAFYAIGVISTPFQSQTSADFKASETVFCSTPATVSFINKSMNAITYLWDFGDGTTSTEKNPVHTYTQEGYYTVTLSVDGGECGDGTVTKTNYIKVDPLLLCNVIMPNTGTTTKEGCAGVFYSPGWPNVYPNNCSSTLIIHAPGAASIVLTIEEFDIEPGAGSSCNYDYVAFYNGNSTSAPKINNTNYCNTTGNPGTITATGEYITIYFYSDVYLQHAGFKILFQCVGGPVPVPEFSVNKTTSCDGLFAFTDQSTNNPLSWKWDFGDGTTSTLKNPTHQYIENGTYTVGLTVTNTFGSSTVQKDNLLTITMPDAPEIDDIAACKDVEFEINLDLEGTAHWYESIEASEPVHIGNVWNHLPIETTTTYYLREAFETCISEFAEVILIPKTCAFDPIPDFTADVETTCTGLVAFTDLSSNEPNEWLWEFGDGKTSDLQNPTHQYLENGSYTVRLTATNDSGSASVEKEDFIIVEMPEQPEIEDITVCKEKEFEITLALEGTAYWYENITDEEPIHVGNSWNHSPIIENITYFLREATQAPEESTEDLCLSPFTEIVIVAEICNVINENQLGNITIYPNPTSGEIQVTSYELRVTSIEIFDVIGRKALTSPVSFPSPETTLNLTHLPTGVYFLKIQTENGVVVRKVVKQ
ncbi:MAG: PKD domain-containing protein [Bacteroidales bacterium]|nr:PKD domain-containing protein [Bacteroidales bacterium]